MEVLELRWERGDGVVREVELREIRHAQHLRQKRPTAVSKETHYSVKRDPLQSQKRRHVRRLGRDALKAALGTH